MKTAATLTLTVLLTALASQAGAEIAVSANDGKQVLIDGVATVPAKVLPDSVSIIDLSAKPPRIIANVAVPTSVIGPPGMVAVARDESYAIVTASRKLSPTDPKAIVPDDVVSVIALKGGAPRVVATHHAGAGASGVSINPAGTIALVANRMEGTVSIFTIARGILTPAGKITIGDAASGPSQPVFFNKGRGALVSMDVAGKVVVLSVQDVRGGVPKVTVTGSIDLPKPYPVDAQGGKFAVVGHGGPPGFSRLSLIDLTGPMPRVVDTVDAPPTPEAAKMSPNGRYVAMNLHNGSGSAANIPGYNPNGTLKIWRIDGAKLVPVAEAPDGAWGQGVAWSKDSKTLLVQAMKDHRIDVFAFDGKTLRQTASLPMPGGPAAIRTAER